MPGTTKFPVKMIYFFTLIFVVAPTELLCTKQLLQTLRLTLRVTLGGLVGQTNNCRYQSQFCGNSEMHRGAECDSSCTVT